MNEMVTRRRIMLGGGYSPCNYVVGCAGGYIFTDINYSASNEYVIEGTARIDDLNGSAGGGSTQQGWDNGGWFGIYNGTVSAAKRYAWFCKSDADTPGDSTPTTPKNFTLDIKSGLSSQTYLTVQGVGSCNRAHASIQAGAYRPYPILALVSENGSSSSPAIYGCPNLRIYHVKISVNGVLKHDFYPYRLGNEGCFFDTVTQTYWHNQGTGTFGFG